jgi:heat shock protein HslJ
MKFVQKAGGIIVIGLFAAFCVVSCASQGKPAGSTAAASQADDFEPSDIVGTTWLLSGIESGGDTKSIDRSQDVYAKCYTLSFGEDGRITGTAFPNRYSMPYTLTKEDDGAVKLEAQMGISTKMMSLAPPPAGLEEGAWFKLLQNASDVLYNGTELIIESENAQGTDVKLHFTAK